MMMQNMFSLGGAGVCYVASVGANSWFSIGGQVFVQLGGVRTVFLTIHLQPELAIIFTQA